MNDEYKWDLTLFQTLRVCGNVYYLIDIKHTYTDILLRINELQKRGLVNKIDDSFKLTEAGLLYYHHLCRLLGKRGLYKYLMELNYNKTTTIDVDEVYIPRKRFRLL